MDPTKTPPVDISKFRRPIAELHIAYNPNTGEITVKSQNFLPIEEIGALSWATNLRLNMKAEPPAGVTQ